MNEENKIDLGNLKTLQEIKKQAQQGYKISVNEDWKLVYMDIAHSIDILHAYIRRSEIKS